MSYKWGNYSFGKPKEPPKPPGKVKIMYRKSDGTIGRIDGTDDYSIAANIDAVIEHLNGEKTGFIGKPLAVFDGGKGRQDVA